MRAFAFAALLLMSLPAQAADKDKIVGTWKLVSVVYEDAQTKELTPVLGEHPRGYQIATPEGRWLALVTADGWKWPGTRPGSAASRYASCASRATTCCTSRARRCRIPMSTTRWCA